MKSFRKIVNLSFNVNSINKNYVNFYLFWENGCVDSESVYQNSPTEKKSP
jgi:hypothetical protein